MPLLKNNGIFRTGFFFCIVFGFFFIIQSPALSSKNPRESAVVLAVRKASPAVVNISSEFEIRRGKSPFSGFGMDPLFDSFFKDFFDPYYERRQKRSSLGSGVIIDGKRGYILTNAHVINKTGTITAILNDEREFKAKIVGADPDSDLAVLKIEASEPLPSIEMGNSDDLMIGETVIAIGNPFGFSNTVTTGVISALHRSIRTQDHVYHDFIQTDASINPGNSGGPLQNINGELIGINTAIYAKAQGIGFAIPINKARRVVADLIQFGEVVPAWIGVFVQDMDDTLARYMKLPRKGGVLVTEVEPKSPASTAKIQTGDIIFSIGDKKTLTVEDYLFAVKNYAKGDLVPFHIFRKDKGHTIKVKASVFPLEKALSLAYDLLGIKVKTAASSGGVVITDLRRNAYLADIGAAPGDIIHQIDEITINNENDFKKAIVKYRSKKTLVILLQRENQLYHITVKI